MVKKLILIAILIISILTRPRHHCGHERIPNSDLHLYIVYNKENNRINAGAVYCSLSSGKIARPNFGRLQKVKIYRGIKTALLASKNVVAVTRKYYNCPTAEGMQIENQGGTGTIGAHWERTVLYNEIMTGAPLSVNRVFSIFTIAALKDTGFYPEINDNMADQIFWGKGKGCDFFEKGCYSNTKFPEFSYVSDGEYCSFEYEGVGVPQVDQFADGCTIVKPYLYELCTNPYSLNDGEEKEQELDKLSHFSTESKCFQSSATDSKSLYRYNAQLRCHLFKCFANASQIMIKFPEIKHEIICEKETKANKQQLIKL
ncbi:leishmanolysin family protein, putative [Ichthyophthirius multifiliis]|uniref:Leishmanolysin family protein, putative n=1 Tax=Ichthyophthirius multifiliis TaxID=5932 RepID=G0R2C8_ICHMU|nr:leishmanolysin family protein, putative [Ichthyophthirius multifiliis]EGR28385.1 leishmanolysin family protein, putative [Ichthyophthirius multifiliis]|eukprot:XP_004027730.1 leishmanolysin family protein, putative [Ichthyophthirius multifiliis]